MRQREALGRETAAVVIEQVEIEGPSRVRDATPPPEAGLEREERRSSAAGPSLVSITATALTYHG